MLDKSLPYQNIIMEMDGITVQKTDIPELPAGYQFHFYQEGDEEAWAKIEQSVLEFEETKLAKEYFIRVYASRAPELSRRCVFVQNPAGELVATATAWFAQSALGRQASLHWVAVTPSEQGKGLGKKIVQMALCQFAKLEPGADVLLHTQTWSHKAVALYHSLGFHILKKGKLAENVPGQSAPRIYPNNYRKAMRVLKRVFSPPLYQSIVENAG